MIQAYICMLLQKTDEPAEIIILNHKRVTEQQDFASPLHFPFLFLPLKTAMGSFLMYHVPLTVG